MAYCNHCNVELKNGETLCPLCGMPLTGTDEGERGLLEEPTLHERVEYNRPLFLGVVTVILTVSMVITLLVDIAFHQGITWSFYSLITITAFWTMLVFPILYRGSSPMQPVIFQLLILSIYLLIVDNHGDGITWAWYPALSLLAVSTFLAILRLRRAIEVYTLLVFTLFDLLLFQFLLDLFSGGSLSWFISLSLPLSLLVFIDTLILTIVIRKNSGRIPLSKAVWAVVLLILCLSTMSMIIINLLVTYHIEGVIKLTWSIVTTISLIPAIVLSLVIYIRDDLQNVILKKLHI
jgi:hypothetical protein